jgi:hypothetical protein
VGPNEIAVYINDAGYYLVAKVVEIDAIGVDHNLLHLIYYILDPDGSPVLGTSSADSPSNETLLVGDNGDRLTDDDNKRLTVEPKTFSGTGMLSTGTSSTAGKGRASGREPLESDLTAGSGGKKLAMRRSNFILPIVNCSRARLKQDHY